MARHKMGANMIVHLSLSAIQGKITSVRETLVRECDFLSHMILISLSVCTLECLWDLHLAAISHKNIILNTRQRARVDLLS